MGVVKPTDDELKELQAEMANTPPDPNSQFLAASADQAAAQAVKARADTVLVVAKTQESKAKTAEILAGIELGERQHVLEVVDRMTKE
jgi:hypothetical protein